MFQTEVQNANAIRIGSCKFEAEAWPGSFTDMTNVGILSGAVLTVKRKTNTIQPDNAPEIPVETRVTGVQIDATLKEWSLETLELLGLGTVVDTASTPVSGASTTILSGNWSYQQFIPVTSHPSASITSVTGSEDDALEEDTDYVVVTTEAGVTGVIIIDSTEVTTESQNLVIVYAYTPVATKTIKLHGSGGAPSYVAVQLTNLNASSKTYGYKVFKAVLTSEIKHAFTSDAEGKEAGLPITLIGYVDSSRDADDNVMEIFDQQAV